MSILLCSIGILLYALLCIFRVSKQTEQLDKETEEDLSKQSEEVPAETTEIAIIACPFCGVCSKPLFGRVYQQAWEAWVFYECPLCGLRYTQRIIVIDSDGQKLAILDAD